MTSAFSWQNSYQSLPCFIPYSKAKFACYSRCFLTSTFAFQSPIMKRTFLGVSSKRSYRSSQNRSASSALLVGAQAWITMILNGLPWEYENLNFKLYIVVSGTWILNSVCLTFQLSTSFYKGVSLLLLSQHMRSLDIFRCRK